MSLGERLYELRKEKHLSQEQVAEQLNVTRQTISKWETDESKPDFDKIVPICNLYGISTELLLIGDTGNTENSKDKLAEEKVNEDKQELKKKRALFVISGILCFFLAIMLVIIGEETLNLNEGIFISVFLFLTGIGVCLLIYQGIAFTSKKPKKELSEKGKKINSLRTITCGIFTVIYFLVSFLTMAWYITWLIWIIYGVVFEIIKIIVEMEENKNE